MALRSTLKTILIKTVQFLVANDKRMAYVPVLCTIWVACPTYVILYACFTTDIVDEVCTPWRHWSNVAAAKAMLSVIIFIEYFVPLALMIFWYSRIVYALRTKVTTHHHKPSLRITQRNVTCRPN